MSGPRFFVNPFGSPAIDQLAIPPHLAGIVPIINPNGSPAIVAIGHNGFSPFAHQINIGQLSGLPHAHPVHNTGHHSGYDFIGVIVVTKSPKTGMFEILLPVMHSSVVIDLRQVHGGDNSDTLLHRMLDDYGISHFGKHTQIRHVEHSNGCKYKFCIVYAPELSRTRINARRTSRYHKCVSLQRFFLPKHKVGSSIKDNYGNNKSVDFATSNIIYAVANMLSTITY
jgi:hypothetical protein